MSLHDSLSEWGQAVASSDALQAIEGLTEREDVKRFVRLWMIEGIPFAFKDKPVLYEMLREWIAEKLNVHPMDVSLVGSGRLGFSLSPQKWLSPFSPGKSDLDAFIVSSWLFEAAREDYYQWIGDWDDGYLTAELSKPRASLWPENREFCASTVGRGFLDENKIPARGGYDTIIKCRKVSEKIPKLVVDQDGSELFRRASFRIFENWDAAVRQSTINLNWTLQNAPKK